MNNNKSVLSDRVKSLEESQTLAFEKRAKNLKREGKEVISLSAGEPDFPTPKNITEFAKSAIDNGYTKYTDTSGTLELREAICRKLKNENNLEYLPSQVLVSCGAKHSIYNLCQSILNPGDEVIIPTPYWVSYSEQVKLAGAKPIFVEEEDFKIQAFDINKKITNKTKLIMINSPCNPTGSVLSKQSLIEIAQLAVAKNILVMSDEIYEKLIYGKNYDKKHVSIASLSSEIKNLTITVNGVSKSHSMTGWRIGYAAGNQEIITAMIKLQGQMTSNPSSISQMAALEALNGNQSSVLTMRKEFETRRDYMVKRLNKIKSISCDIPEGAFYCFADISKLNKNSLSFANELLDKALVATVPGSAFGKEGYLRLSYATSMQNLIKAMDRIELFIKDNY